MRGFFFGLSPMTPEWKEIALGLLTAVSAIGGWFLRQLHAKTEHLETMLQNVANTLAREYVHKNDLAGFKSDIKEMIDAVFRKLDRIEDKLDQKADK